VSEYHRIFFVERSIIIPRCSRASRFMLSKCANPVCSETFRYLHQGRIFQLSPTPAMQMAAEAKGLIAERFWLCEDCSKKLTVIWDGAHAKVAPLPEKPKVSRIVLSMPGEAPLGETAAVEASHRPGWHQGLRAAFAGRRPR
jgi:hypothetical protein